MKMFFQKGQLTLVCLMMAVSSLFAQNDTVKPAFKPNGKPIVTVFGNFHSVFTSPQNTGFELERAYLGYQHNFSPNVSAKVVVDMGKSSDVSDLNRLVYLKNAVVTWRKGNFTLNAGLTGMQLFDVQEKGWGHRYLMKSFQDEYKFGHSADLGLVMQYKFASWAKADLTLVNGDGYKKVNLGTDFLYGAGLTFLPVDGLTLRVYGSYRDFDHSDSLAVGQGNLSCFVGYSGKTVSAGAEYDAMWNANNASGKHEQGVSAFVRVNLPKNFEVFARWDYLMSLHHWNSRDEHAAVAGFQYAPNKHVRIAPNVRVGIPRGDASNPTVSGYVNMEVKL